MGYESEMIRLSGHLCTRLHKGHARRSRLISNYRITVSGSLDLIHSIEGTKIIFLTPLVTYYVHTWRVEGALLWDSTSQFFCTEAE